MATRVTDPALLAELEGSTTPISDQRAKRVTDPALLAELNRQAGLEGQKASAQQVYGGVNPLAKMAVGVGASAAEPVLGLAQLATKGAERLGVPGAASATAGIEDRLASVRGAREGAGGWGTAGEVASWLAPGKAIAGVGTAALRKLGT
jgi:hypothetical protein